MERSIDPPADMPVKINEGRIEVEGAHAYSIGKSFDQHPYGEGTRAAIVFKRGWMSQRDASRD